MGTTQAVNILFILGYLETDVSTQSYTRVGGEVVGTREQKPPSPTILKDPCNRTILPRIYNLSYYYPPRPTLEGYTLVAAETS